MSRPFPLLVDTPSGFAAYRAEGAGPLTSALLARELDVPLDALLQPVCPGLVVYPVHPCASPPTVPCGSLVVECVAGPGSGAAAPLQEGVVRIGRSRHCELMVYDETLPPLAAHLEQRDGSIWLHQAESDSPELLASGQEFLLGSSRFRVRQLLAKRPISHPDDDGFERVDRPPLARTQLPACTIDVPDLPRASGRRPSFSWVLFGAPLLIGAVLAVLVSPSLALFALLSPLMAVASWIEQRRSHKRDGREIQHSRADALRYFDERLGATRRRLEAHLREIQPDIGHVRQMVVGREERLWSRRRADADSLCARLGTGDLPWQDADLLYDAVADQDLREILKAHRTLLGVPLAVNLRRHRVIGVVGAASDVDPVVRALILDLVAHQGPADLGLQIDAHDVRWDWLAVLPHFEGEAVGESVVDGRPTVVICDRAHALASGSSNRKWVDEAASAMSFVVLGPDRSHLPDCCTVVIEIGPHGPGDTTIHFLDPPLPKERGYSTRLSLPLAVHLATSLAPLVDPDANLLAIPAHVDLADVLDLEGNDGSTALADRWDSTTSNLVATVGHDGQRPVQVDLVSDGPHALIGGTTGSGKSELLRSLVTSLAVTYSPSAVTFLLIDYKGGAAFDAAVGLPHTVGVVTDLNHGLAARALRSLEAELRYREQRLRDAGVTDLADLTSPPAEGSPGLPRLVVVVDEFATLAREQEDFLRALVDVAQRGRSLGIHLILATQRPSGVISDNIRTNTNLRIALRMIDTTDSIDVIGSPAAAQLRPDQPGRALIRTGPGNLREFQIALGRTMSSARPARVIRVGHGQDRVVAASSEQQCDNERTDTQASSLLALLSPELSKLALELGIPSVRRPWLDPIPTPLDPDEAAMVVPGFDPCQHIGLLDDPDQQRQLPLDASTEGTTLVVGRPRSGVSTALRAMACAVAARADPVHLYLIGSADDFRGFDSHPRVAARIPMTDHDLLLQLTERLEQPPDQVPSGVFIDDLARLFATADDVGGMSLVDRWLRLITTPRPGDLWVIGANRVSAIPQPVLATSTRRIVLALNDRFDHALLGVPAACMQDGAGPGACFDSSHDLAGQIVWRAPESESRHRIQILPGETPPVPLSVLPDFVEANDLPWPTWTDGALSLTIGRGRDGPAALLLPPGASVLVAGSAGSGVSSTLALIASLLESDSLTSTDLAVTGTPRSPLNCLKSWVPLDAVPSRSARVVLIDDVHLLADSSGELTELITNPTTIVIAGGQIEALRRQHQHWTRPIRDSPYGIAIRPGPTPTADLWSTPVPAHRTLALPGRAVLLDHGHTTTIQVAHNRAPS